MLRDKIKKMRLIVWKSQLIDSIVKQSEYSPYC